MRTLAINKQTIYYALYNGTQDVVIDGSRTGEKRNDYSPPVKVRMNVSAAKGTADTEQFGITDEYTKTVVTDDMVCPIDTESILWIGITPDANGEGGAVKHNYRVVRVAKSINSITYAVREVDVS